MRQAPFGFVLCALAVTICAQANAKMAVNGNAADKETFQKLLDKCKGESKTFKEILDNIDKTDKTVSFDVGRNQKGVTAGAFKKGGPQTINLSGLELSPNPKKDAETHKFVFPKDGKGNQIPSWARTICERLGHELEEQYHSATTGDDYAESHKDALDQQNKIRGDFDQNSKVVSQTYDDTTKSGVITFDDGHTETFPINANGNPGGESTYK